MPSLDELRARMARILAPPAAPAVDEPADASPASAEPCPLLDAFGEQHTSVGPLFVRHKLTPAGHRIGHAPLWGSRRADGSLLALLALDPSLAERDVKRALYIDTETTGLAGGTGTVPFLLGLAYERDEEEGVVVEQVLLRRYAEEPAMLEHLRARLEQASMIVTYNGKSFDWPLLQQRAIMNRLPPLPERPHLDLLHLARRLHGHRLASCSLGQIESHVLGRVRVGDVAGADIAAIYFHYARSGDAWVLEPVLEHNTLDVLSMVALVGLYGEPLEGWARASEIAAASLVVQRAGAEALAESLAATSIARGAGAFGHRVAGDLARARGDKAAALRAYESALSEPEAPAFSAIPKVRLELAKLYEHHAKSFEKALLVLAETTVEHADAHAKRRDRVAKKLVRKIEKNLDKLARERTRRDRARDKAG